MQLKYLNDSGCQEDKAAAVLAASPCISLLERPSVLNPITHPRPPDPDGEAKRVRNRVTVTFTPHCRVLGLGTFCVVLALESLQNGGNV